MSPPIDCSMHTKCSCSGADERQPIVNRAGLTAIKRRVGTFSSFRSGMLREVDDVISAVATETATEPRPTGWVPVETPLQRWNARTSDDIGVALVEAASVVLDVLTFYQERIANESYLRTAREDDSIEAMVSLLGYELSPGVTAAASIVFEIEPGRSVTVPAWSQVQSVPADGELPQTFETTSALAADGGLSHMRPVPPATQFSGVTSELRIGGRPTLEAGDTVLVGSRSSAVRRTISSLDTSSDDTVVQLSATVELGDQTRIWPVLDVAKGYGGDLPSTAVHTYLNQSGTWVSHTVSRPAASSGTTVYLDRTLEPIDSISGLGVPGSHGTWAIRPIITSGVTKRGEGPLERTVTSVTTGAFVTEYRRASIEIGGRFVESSQIPLAAIQDPPLVIAGASVSLVGDAIRPERDIAAPVFPAGTTKMTFPGTDLGTLAAGRSIIVDDGRNVHLATVVEVDAPGEGFEFQPGLPSPFQAAETVVYGNVVEARHGERHTDEALGDGDPTAVSQEFKLRRGPLAWRLDGTSPQGASPDVEVRVDDVRWSWVSKRVVEDTDEPRYAIGARDDDSYVQIGGLAGGTAANRGKRNVVADYRVGGGLEGNVAAGSLSTPLDRPPGLRQVTNPLPAQGGSDRESAEHARTAAPVALRASGRIVALPDFENAALDFPGVAKAHATWTWGNLTQLLHLTVAGEGGAELSTAALDELHRFLDRQRDDRRPLRIDNFLAVPISVRLEVTADERVRPDDVGGEVIAVIEDGFGFEEIQFGRAVDASKITEQLHEIDAVLGVRWLELTRAGPGSRGAIIRRALPVLSRSRFVRRVTQDAMPRVPIRGAVAVGSHQVRPAELAIIDVTRRDVVVKSAPRPERLT